MKFWLLVQLLASIAMIAGMGFLLWYGWWMYGA